MQRAGPAESRPKVAAIQALRALAALSVALVHLTFGFARHVDRQLAWLPSGEQLAQAAVALFFVISGCVMVLSSGPLFGSVRGSLTFWRRRAVRVLPPYWIATGLLVATVAALGRPFDPAFAAHSLAFLPTVSSTGSGVPFELFLWPGWSLLYELLFYALFGAFMLFGRKAGVALTAAALLALVVLGGNVSPGDLVSFSATRPILLLFIAGMGFGLALKRGLAVSSVWRLAALAAAVGLFAIAPPPVAPLGFGYLLWAGLPAVLLFFAVLAGPLRLPLGWLSTVLGDASYAVYLLHVPFAHLWMRLFKVLDPPGGSLAYLALGVPLLIALSLAFHRWIEQPLTDRLNRMLGDRGAKRGELTRTLAP